MHSLFFMIAAGVIGMCLSMQPPINAVMARTLGSPLLAATISIGISFVLMAGIWLAWERGFAGLTQFKALPWWVVLGGAIGVIFVAGSIVVAPVIGVALFFVCVVAGQLIGASLADHLGAFGMEVKPLSLMKGAGLLLVVAGAVLVQRG